MPLTHDGLTLSVSGRDDPEVDSREDGHSGIPALHAGSADGDYEGYLCTISGELLAQVYERHGSRLLEGNVRSFLSVKGKINSGIQDTIAKKPAMFFCLQQRDRGDRRSGRIRSGHVAAP